VSFVNKTATRKCTKPTTETGTTPACSSKFCDMDFGPVMDGCTCVNVEGTSYNGQRFLETVNRSLLAVGGKLVEGVGVGDTFDINL